MNPSSSLKFVLKQGVRQIVNSNKTKKESRPSPPPIIVSKKVEHKEQMVHQNLLLGNVLVV